MSRLKKVAAKFTQQSFKETVLRDGSIPLDKGQYNFVVTQINDKNFPDMTPKLKQQLEDENKWDMWIGFVAYGTPYSIQMLPIYGNTDRYVTKWFATTAATAIDQCLSDRSMGLLKRANDK